MMKIATMLKDLIGYFSDGAARIFSLDRNTPPKIGVQPFEGDIQKDERQN
jgi:hypothetical protein